MKTVIITNLSRPDVKPIQAGYCASFLCILRGLMFYNSIPVGDGLLFVYKHDDRVNSAIHMLNMRFDLCVVWINKAGEVVDVVHAKKGKLGYAPKAPANLVLEIALSHINDFHIGDKVRIDGP